jgi:hypothetical protein
MRPSGVGSATKRSYANGIRLRLKQNKSLTWKNKEVKSKFHSNNVMLITDFGDMDEAREWKDKIEAEAKQTE